MRIYMAASMGMMLLAFTATPNQAQQTQSRQVRVAVLEDYPAFQVPASQRHPRAKQLRALVIRQDPADSQFSIILLNPAHLNVNTLGDAVRALATCSSTASRTLQPNFVPVGIQAHHDAAQPRDAAQLTRWLDELRGQPTAEIRALGGTGRSIMVSAVSACMSPAAK